MAEKRELGAYERIRAICRRDARYRQDAYYWIFEALEHTLRSLPAPRHVTGQELCHGIRLLALERFGPLARAVFRSWGVTRTDDFGRIVFHLIEVELMGKTEQDSFEDFQGVFDFAEAFDEVPRDVRLSDVFVAGGAPAMAPLPRKEPALF